MEDLQRLVDSIKYPPTHTYILNGLRPTGDLKRRFQVITKMFPEFFTAGSTLLDVGCNKGFFSLINQGSVVGIDPDHDCIELCKKLKPNSIFKETTFGKFECSVKFDKIFVGNGHHYLFLEYDGWGFVEKLANLSEGLVLVEGPVDMTGVDAQRCIPKWLAPSFRIENLLEAFDSFFSLVRMYQSPLVDRYFLMFKRRDPAEAYERFLIDLYSEAARYIGRDDNVLEICTRHDRGVLGKRIINCHSYTFLDGSPNRPGLTLDAVREGLPKTDVLISTAILHHTAPGNIRALLTNLSKSTKYKMILSGPDASTGVPLYGDHLYHINAEEIDRIMDGLGWRKTIIRPWGFKYCKPHELFMVFERK